MARWCTRFIAVLAAMSLVARATKAQTPPTHTFSPAGDSTASRAENAHRDLETNAVRQGVLSDASKQGLSVLDIRPIGKRTQSARWAVVMGKSVQGSDKPYKEISDITLRMYVKEGTNYRFVSSKGPLIDPRFEDWPASSIELQCLDLNNDGLDEVILIQGRVGASWLPGCAFVFMVRSNGLVPVGTITSHYDIQIGDVEGDRHYEITSTYAIGTKMPHFEQPRWTDYYGYDGTQMVLVNNRLSRQFLEWPAILTRALDAYPDDPELWFYLGDSYRILGRDQEAARAFTKAGLLGYRTPATRAPHTGIEIRQDAQPNVVPPRR